MSEHVEEFQLQRLHASARALDDIAYGDLSVGWSEVYLDPVWDALVEATPGGDLVQSTLWGTVRQRCGMRVCHIRISAPNGELVGGSLIQYRRLLPKVCVGVVPRGPLVFAKQPGIAYRLVQEIVAVAKRLNIVLLIVQPPEHGEALIPAMTYMGFRVGGPNIAPDATIRLNLRRPEEEILRCAHRSRRPLIRAATRAGLEGRISDDIETFHRLHVASASRQGFSPIGLDNLRAQWEILGPKGRCHIIEVRHNGEPIAAEWMTSFAGTVTSRFRGHRLSNATTAAKNAGTASLWACIQWARSAGAHNFDFGGFDRSAAEAVQHGRPLPPNIQSASRIKWSFGGEVTVLPKPRFLLASRPMQLTVGALIAPLLSSSTVRHVTQRLRSGRSHSRSGGTP